MASAKGVVSVVFTGDVVVKSAGSGLNALAAGTYGTEGGEKAVVERSESRHPGTQVSGPIVSIVSFGPTSTSVWPVNPRSRRRARLPAQARKLPTQHPDLHRRPRERLARHISQKVNWTGGISTFISQHPDLHITCTTQRISKVRASAGGVGPPQRPSAAHMCEAHGSHV